MISLQENTILIQQKQLNKEDLLSSFLQLFEQHRGMLYTVALRMLGYGEDAKDAVQEIFIKAYTHLHTLHDTNALGSWLRTILYNHCLMELRYRKKQMKALHDYAKEKEIITYAVHAAEESPGAIKTILSGLSETLQLTAMLRFFSRNSSYEEIAQILSIPLGTVRSRLAESRTKLASLLMQKDQALKNNKAKEREAFYQYHIADMYDDTSVRNAFISHFDKKIYIFLTSGKTRIGSDYMRKEIEFDLKYGARATLAEVHSSGSVISILELNNINPADNPNLCPASATFILVHPKTRVEKAFLHNAPNLPHKQ